MKFYRKPKPEPADVDQKLRLQSLQASRAELGIPAMQTEAQPWGVLMDGGIASGSATVVALSDPNASIYLSSAGGSHRHRLSRLGHAMQEIITQYEKIQQ